MSRVVQSLSSSASHFLCLDLKHLICWMGTLPPAQTLLQSSGQAAGVKVHGRLMLQTLPHLSNEERGSEKVGDPPEATQHGFPSLGPAPSALSCSSSSSREEMRRSLFSRTYGSFPTLSLLAILLPRHLCTYNEAGDSCGPWQAQFSLQRKRDQGGYLLCVPPGHALPPILHVSPW